MQVDHLSLAMLLVGFVVADIVLVVVENASDEAIHSPIKLALLDLFVIEHLFAYTLDASIRKYLAVLLVLDALQEFVCNTKFDFLIR